MEVFEGGIILLRISGIIPWNVSVWWKKYISYFYMFHIPFAFIYLICIHLAAIVLYWEDTRQMLNILWRVCGLITLFAQGFIPFFKGDKLKKLFTIPRDIEKYYFKTCSLRKRINFKLYVYTGSIGTFMIAYLIRKFLLKDSVAYNGNNDVEFLIPNMISNPILAYMVHIHLSIVILQNFVVLFGLDFLYIYSLALIQEFIEYLEEKLNCMDVENNRNVSDVQHYQKSHCKFKHCVMVHKHIIQMTDTTNEVFSFSQLLLVWRAFVMSIAAYELTKRIEHLVSFVEVFMFLSVTLLQMFTMCLVAQNCKEQSKGLVDVCTYKAWSDVFSVSGPKIQGDRRSLLVMAARCNSPLDFSAGPFYRLSLDTFVAVMGLSFSYYMFFFSIKLRNEQ